MPKERPPDPPLPTNRRGQLASERARFELRGEEKVLEEGLGTLPPGYGLTFVRGWIRDPRHLVATWDVNDEEGVRQAETVGWDRLCLRALDARSRVLVQLLVGRRAGTHHIEVPAGRTVRLAIGIERRDGYFLTLARSGPVRLPPDSPSAAGPVEALRLPAGLDRRTLVRSENPARPGHRTPGRLSGARRLFHRVLLALRVLPPTEVPAELQGDDRGATASLGAGLAPPAAAAAGTVLAEEDHGLREGEAVTSPAGWVAPGGPGGPFSQGHWLDRWASGPAPTSPGAWLSGRPSQPEPDAAPKSPADEGAVR